jgi:tRNA(Ile)-lysidine synthase
VLARIQRTIREHGLLAPGDRVLVALSGGPDSTALLHGLRASASRLGCSLAAVCVDHGLRPESASEAQTVAARCRDAGIECEVVRVNVARYRRQHGSLQEAAREARLSVLARVARRLRCGKVALGHTADDQAETVLFRIVRGTGLPGLAGIPYRRGVFIRPLLDVRRAQVLAFLAKRRLPFVEDPSNLNRRFARSRIRHDILPLLAHENPRVVEALLGLAAHARDLGRDAAQATPAFPKGVYVSRGAAATIAGLAKAGRGTARVSVAGGEVEIRYGEVGLRREAIALPEPAVSPRAISRAGVYRAGAAGTMRLYVARGGRVSSAPVEAVCFDASALRWPLRLRARSAGDRMRPRGGPGRRKLSDLLIDAKVPRPDRAALPVLCDGDGEILYVPGLRPSEFGRPTATTRHPICVWVAR